MSASEPKTQNAKIATFLRAHPGQRFTAREIARALVERHPDWARAKITRSKQHLDDNGLLQQIVAEIGAQRHELAKKYPAIQMTEDRPRIYYWSSGQPTQPHAAPAETASRQIDPAPGLREADLYPALGRYLHGELGLWPKRIDEKATTKKAAGFNRWLFPDLVAMELMAEAWPSAARGLVHELVREMWGNRVRLWSFEVKLRLDRGSAREAFFQAVSNSSWANLAYLVAAEIAGDGTLDELRVLSGLHGIGLVRLDAEDASESEILVPARERSEVDWASLARLAGESDHVQKFVQGVTGSLKAGQPLKDLFDYVRSRAT